MTERAFVRIGREGCTPAKGKIKTGRPSGKKSERLGNKEGGQERALAVGRSYTGVVLRPDQRGERGKSTHKEKQEQRRLLEWIARCPRRVLGEGGGLAYRERAWTGF